MDVWAHRRILQAMHLHTNFYAKPTAQFEPFFKLISRKMGIKKPRLTRAFLRTKRISVLACRLLARRPRGGLDRAAQASLASYGLGVAQALRTAAPRAAPALRPDLARAQRGACRLVVLPAEPRAGLALQSALLRLEPLRA